DLPVELERRLVEVVERHRRAEVAADVQAVVRGEGQWCRDGYATPGDLLAVDPQCDVERRRGLCPGQPRFDLDRHLAGGELPLRLDRRALNLEQVVLVAKYTVLDVAGQPAGERAEGVQHATGVLGHLDLHADEVAELAELRGGELRHAGDRAAEGPG